MNGFTPLKLHRLGVGGVAFTKPVQRAGMLSPALITDTATLGSAGHSKEQLLSKAGSQHIHGALQRSPRTTGILVYS